MGKTERGKRDFAQVRTAFLRCLFASFNTRVGN